MVSPAELQHLPSRLELAAGAEGGFVLPGALGGGYRWQVEAAPAGAGIAEVSVVRDAAPAAGTPGAEPPPLALATERAHVRALHAGTARWRLVLVRPFGPPVPLAVHDLEVTVSAAR